MASITREQLNRWNGKLTNGFTLDLRQYIFWGEKQAELSVPLDDGKELHCEIGYRDITHNFQTIGQQPTLTLSVWHPTSTPGVFSSRGLGYREDIGTPQTKKNFNVLAKLTGLYNAENLLKLAAEHVDELKNEYIMGGAN